MAVAKTPIERLKPGSDLHAEVLTKLLDRINMSERSMSTFYDRWRTNEMRLQAWINLPKYERMLAEATESGAPPMATSIVIPYAFATVWTQTTYLLHTFAGRRPIIPLSSYSPEMISGVKPMETVLQYNADHTRLIKHWNQWFMDMSVYGFGALRTLWTEKKAYRTRVQKEVPNQALAGSMISGPIRELRTIYEGNDTSTIDPFDFFPDPRCPMNEVNKKGEFVFWRSFEGQHTLLKEEAAGNLAYVRDIPELLSRPGDSDGTQSARNKLSRGEAQAGDYRENYNGTVKNYTVHQGTVEIIPEQWGLGDETFPVKYLFSIGNKSQIIQAEPFDYDHGMHPVVVAEPHTLGYAFGQPGVMDWIGPVQDLMSWMINSHIANVRAAINNMFVFDPMAIEYQDLKTPQPGKLIRLKPGAAGRRIEDVIRQFNVTDVTRGHVQELPLLMRFADMITGVGDNLRGVQESGGRKTATEVRVSGESGASRMASVAKAISAQGMQDFADQWILNNQQFLSFDFQRRLTGSDSMPIEITRELLNGDFYFQAHDGTLPIDKVAMLDIWREIFMGMLQDPELRQQYDVGKTFEYIAKLGGAENIGEFRKTPAEVQVQSEEQIAQGVQSGNMVNASELGAIPFPGLRGAGAPTGGL